MRRFPDVLRAGGVLGLKGAGAAATFGWNIALARQLGPTVYGEFVVAFAIAAFGAVMVRLGLDLPVLREAAGGTDSSLYRRALSTVFLGSVVVGALLLLGSPVLEVTLPLTEWSSLRGWVTLAVPAVGGTWIAGERLKGSGQAELGVAVQHVLPHAIFLVALVWVPSAGAADALTLFILAWVVSLVVGLGVGARHLVGPLASGRQVLDVLPLFVLAVMNVTIMWVDVFMLSALIGSDAAGLYTPALRLGWVPGFVLVATSSVLAPRFAGAPGRLGAGFHATLRRGLSTGLIFASLVAATVWLARVPLLGLFGSEYLVAQNALGILLVGQGLHAILGLAGYALVMSGGDRAMGRIAVLAGVVNVIANAVLIPTYGMVGAAVATAAALVLMDGLALVVCLRSARGLVSDEPRGYVQ